MTHINQRRDSAANWTYHNPVLHEGEVGWESDTRQAKLGDGVTPWTALPYAVTPGGGGGGSRAVGIVARIWDGSAWPVRETTGVVHWIDPHGTSTPPTDAMLGDLYSIAT